MEDLGTLFFLLFVLWPLIAGLLRRGQGTRPPGAPRQGQRPGHRQGPAGRPSAPRTSEEPARAEPVSAADMIPDELWEILTGERRRPAPVSAPPAPAPAEAGEERPVWEEAVVLEEDEEEEWEPVVPPQREPERGVSLEVEPVIVSLEESVPSAEERHAAFHARIAAAAQPVRRRRRERLRLNLGGADELRRMVVLREVLGPPKALE